ncbi:MAG: glycosyltransferase [Bacteroidales bacterium]|nr:glycosyltransferase [Bacteroidales bacterium]
MPTTVLYISEDYPYTQVHHNLCQSICTRSDETNILVYCVIRRGIHVRDLRKHYHNINYGTLFYEFKGNEWRYKFDFFYKTRKKYAWLIKNCDISTIALTHAATLFSEGVISLKLYKKYGIPYIVSVRGSDLNFYFKFMPYLWKLGMDILKHAKRIVFITERSSKQLLKKNILSPITEDIKKRSLILPNGIDSFWIKNVFDKRTIDVSQLASNADNTLPHRLLYIGLFDSNKNVTALQQEVIKLHQKFKNLHLTLIGGGGNRHNQVLKYCQKYPNLFEYKGKIYDKTVLLDIIRAHNIFTMISHSETFGLVYIEALSQGLPVLYTIGQGIDGVFHEKIGEAVNSHDRKDIARGLTKMILNYNDYHPVDNIMQFSWAEIARQYITLAYQ